MGTINHKPVYGILLLVLIFFIILVILTGYAISVVGERRMVFPNEPSGDQIGVVEINGIIMDSKPIVELLEKAEKDEDVKAIIVRINSPGGAVAPTQEIYEEIRRIDGQFDPKEMEGKPVYASFASVAASGGYYIGSATRNIYANPGTLTGSIGVIMNFVDMTKLYEWAKLNPETIKAGRFKDIGSTHRPMRDDERALLQGMAVNVHRQFIEDIMETRRGRIKEDIEMLAQGQIFSGEMAFKHGLVDELAGLWEAGRRIYKELELEGELDLKFIKKKKRRSLLEIVEHLEEVVSNIHWKGVVQSTPMFLVR